MNSLMVRDTVRDTVLISGKVNNMNSTERGMRRTWGENTSLIQVKGEY